MKRLRSTKLNPDEACENRELGASTEHMDN